MMQLLCWARHSHTSHLFVCVGVSAMSTSTFAHQLVSAHIDWFKGSVAHPLCTACGLAQQSCCRLDLHQHECSGGAPLVDSGYLVGSHCKLAVDISSECADLDQDLGP